MSAATSTPASASSARARLIGDPPRLPLRIAVHVARTSIRVRLSRSLVTVSSVVLAVAFLLTVIGENVVLRAVYGAWHDDSASLRHAQRVRETLERPRPLLDLLRVAAVSGDGFATWIQSFGGTRPVVDSALAATAVELSDWIAELPPSKSYLILGNRRIDEWLVEFRSAAQVEALLTTTRELKGVRLTIARERIAALAAGMPALADALQAAVTAEGRRLEQIAAAGGTDAVLQRIQEGADIATLTGIGMPIDQILPDVVGSTAKPEAREALARQLALDRARIRAVDVITRANGIDPNLLTAEDVRWESLASSVSEQAKKAASPLHQIAKANALDVAAAAALLSDASRRSDALASLNRAIASPGLWKKDAWAGIALGSDAEALTKRVRLPERQQTRLGRLLLDKGLPGAFAAAPPSTPLELRTVLTDGLTGDPREKTLTTQLQAATGSLALTDLRDELARRGRLSEIERTFASLGYDPEKAGAKTFWLVVLSLLVCTVGIVNTMMMAVTERFREIATMKCLGATDGFVLKAFLIESSMVGSAGALLGAVIGFLLVLVQGAIRFGGPFWSAFPVSGLAAAAGISLACGLVLAVAGALLPALKASRMHPIEAMRIDA